jgi:C-terminal processing protease CtpA/Prc
MPARQLRKRPPEYMIQPMNPVSVFAAVLLAASPAFAAEPPRPAPDFKALPLSERNLTRSDAAWENVGNSDFDARLPASAAAATSQQDTERLIKLLSGGPGFDETTLRRGSKSLRLVTEVRPGSPAAHAGISPGWRVLDYRSRADANGETLRFTGEFLPLDARAAEAWERGAAPDVAPDPSKVVKVDYLHRGLEARRAIESRRIGKGLRYVRFDGFGDDEFMKPVFQALDEAGPDGLIIDLRWNAGGLKHQAQKVAGVLLGDGVTLGHHVADKGPEPVLATKPRRRYEGPLVLLVGPRSAHCSEVLAAAIQDHRRGKLVGRMTNGSLSASAYPLPDGGFASTPLRDFRSANQKKLEGVGVAPDIRVLPTLADVRAGRDPALERAVQVIRARGGGMSPLEERPSRYRNRRGEIFPPL